MLVLMHVGLFCRMALRSAFHGCGLNWGCTSTCRSSWPSSRSLRPLLSSGTVWCSYVLITCVWCTGCLACPPSLLKLKLSSGSSSPFSRNGRVCFNPPGFLLLPTLLTAPPGTAPTVQTPISVSARGRWLLQEWLNLNMDGWHTLNQPTYQAAAASFRSQGPPLFIMLPTGSIPKVLQHLRASQQPALILAPLWEAQIWLPGLASQSDWVIHVPPALKQQFRNLPSVCVCVCLRRT